MKVSKYFSIFCILILAACNPNKEDEKIATDPKQLFQEGLRSISEDKYKVAVKSFETLEREHPASDLAPEATIRKAYTFYLNNNFDEALFTIEDFLRQYPGHTSVPYMYYLKALCYYDQIIDLGRDQTLTQQALDALQEVITRFPESSYANDAKLKRDYAFNQLAGKEMEIGLFYLNSGKPTAALNRFKAIIDNYSTSIFIPEALYRMTEIYYSLGINDQAEKYASVLGHNFPNSEWYTKAYNLVKKGESEKNTSLTRKIIKKLW